MALNGKPQREAHDEGSDEAPPALRRGEFRGDGERAVLAQKEPPNGSDGAINESKESGQTGPFFPRAMDTERVGGVDEAVRHGLNGVRGVEQDKRDGREEDEHDLLHLAQSEPDQRERDERS